jgi:hypothetical protein
MSQERLSSGIGCDGYETDEGPGRQVWPVHARCRFAQVIHMLAHT